MPTEFFRSAGTVSEKADRADPHSKIGASEELDSLHLDHEFLSIKANERTQDRETTVATCAKVEGHTHIAELMCEIHYTLYSCGCWRATPEPGTKEMLRLCEVAVEKRLGMPCKEKDRGVQHKVVTRSQGMCDKHLWKEISK